MQKKMNFISFSGLAPVKGLDAQAQRNNFAQQLSAIFSIPRCTFTDWADAFNFLTNYLKDSQTVILFDEISWMAHDDNTFIPKLKNWWDDISEKSKRLVFVMCGSISTWIEKNIINSTAFFGRITLTLHLQELSLAESYQLLLEKKI